MSKEIRVLLVLVSILRSGTSTLVLLRHQPLMNDWLLRCINRPSAEKPPVLTVRPCL